MMASRVQFSRVLRLSFRPKPTLLRPQVAISAARWRCITSTAYPSRSSSHFTQKRVHPSMSKSVVASGATKRGFASAGLTLQELDDRVLNVLKLFDKVQPEKVTVEAHFMNDLGLDSLDVVEVVMAFEDEFAVEISDEEAEKVFTCKDAIELLKAKLDLH